jgi:hypothetical protein
MPEQRVYKVLFYNQGKLYELYARRVGPSDLMGFVEVADLIFAPRSEVLVDPAEERLEAEFSGVRRVLVPMQAMVRIDEVEREGTNRIRALSDDEKVTPFPFPGGGQGPRRER